MAFIRSAEFFSLRKVSLFWCFMKVKLNCLETTTLEKLSSPTVKIIFFVIITHQISLVIINFCYFRSNWGHFWYYNLSQWKINRTAFFHMEKLCQIVASINHVFLEFSIMSTNTAWADQIAEKAYASQTVHIVIR